MKNICKFTQPNIYGSLSATCFVMETDEKIMREAARLTSHRILLVTEGHGIFRFDNDAIPFREGSLLFGFEGESFFAEPSQKAVYLYIDFGGGRAEELFFRFKISKNNRSFEGFDGLSPFWRDSLARAQNDTIDLAAESTLLYTFSRLSSQPTEHSGLVASILKLTEEGFKDPELSLSSVAEKLSYNPKYISHAFKQAMKLSYSEYLRDMRIKYATFLFNEGLDSVKNVALLSGFSDPLYFSNTFKKVIGKSPREYIASLSAKVKE